MSCRAVLAAGQHHSPVVRPATARDRARRHISQGQRALASAQRRPMGLRRGPVLKRVVACPATVDDPELQELVAQLGNVGSVVEHDPVKLKAALEAIDEANAQDPTSFEFEGSSYPYRLLYSSWVYGWVEQLSDGKASDAALILARGKSIQSWRITEIDRDNYAPNEAGYRQWQFDRKKWQANRLLDVVREVGYSTNMVRFIEEVILERDVPSPRDVRRFDLQGLLGQVNFALLEQVLTKQLLIDAEALLFLQRNFPGLMERYPTDEVLAVCARELALVSTKAIVRALRMPWTDVQKRLLMRALPTPGRYRGIFLEAEGIAASSLHPGDWRYKNFDYD